LIQIDDNPFYSTNIWDEFSFENPHGVNKDIELHNVISNPLFQLEQVKEFDVCMHTPLDICTFSFNDDDEFVEFPMYLNPLYSSLHYDNPISDREIATYGITIFDESIDPIFHIQTLNLKYEIFNHIDTFNVI
jgi:hypothetical protein